MTLESASVAPLSSPEPLLLPEEEPEELPDELPEELPDELPEELPELLPDELVLPPSSPALDDELHPGSIETRANPVRLTTTADKANLFMCFS